ncbi:FG-GAP-like repeat-containing protein [Bacteroidota bacterium]
MKKRIIGSLGFVLIIFFAQTQTTFSDPILISNRNCPATVFAGDLDNDGDNDVISTSYWDGIIYWYKNIDGYGNFGQEQIITDSADGATCIKICDVDGDKDNDVISASWIDNKIAWYENTDGNGSFGDQQIISTSTIEAHYVYACDIDGDMDIDVLSASYGDNKIAWYENTDGNGNFSEQIIITTTAIQALCVFAIDLDGDEDNDVLSASRGDNVIAWYENIDGNGTFSGRKIISTSVDGPFSVYACDIDSDGDNDVLSASEMDNKIAWYENTNGNGSFGLQKIISTDAGGAEVVYACDIDNDGDFDVLSACYWDDKIAWYENTDGNGDFSEEQIISSTVYGAFSVYALDLDSDGDLDVLSAAIDGNKVDWYRNLIYTKIDEIDNGGILVFPNPTNGIINIELNQKYNSQQIEISDLTGKKIIDKKKIQQIDSIDLSNKKNGIYIIRLLLDKVEYTYRILLEI